MSRVYDKKPTITIKVDKLEGMNHRELERERKIMMLEKQLACIEGNPQGGGKVGPVMFKVKRGTYIASLKEDRPYGPELLSGT